MDRWPADPILPHFSAGVKGPKVAKLSMGALIFTYKGSIVRMYLRGLNNQNRVLGPIIL